VAATTLCAAPWTSAAAQFPTRLNQPWRTIETEHFAFHYPLDLEAWTRAAASHVEAIDSAVAHIVGFRVEGKTDALVDDPFQRPNGSAWPYLNRPLINLWASPPDPRDDIGDYRTWGQMLVAHEFGHITHLARPSRNSWTRRVWEAMPANIGPIALRAPRWVIEGYATYIEGRVTGSGRPHSAWRAAFLRQWAIEGQLPRYEYLDDWGAYAGGSFAYLAGSAFIEWLAERHGDSSLVFVWRRLSARQNRSFDDAFVGVYGQSAAALYGRFTAELTEKSLDIAHTMAAATNDTGAIVQRLARSTGDPAISTDGRRVAIVLRSADAPSRVVIWKTAPEPDTAQRRRDSLLLKKDPEDVPARSIYPPAKTALFTLRSKGGAPYESPRFLRDGRVLLSRSTARGDGTFADDLYLWSPEGFSVRRLTRGASLREPDPSPDGRTAVASRCTGGWCSLVIVTLDDGSVTTLLAANEQRSFFRPRFSPDGKTVLVSVHLNGTWRLATVDVEARTIATIDPDDRANRYDAAWSGANDLVAVSDRGGIANIIHMNLASREIRTLSGVTGAAVAPEPNPSDGSIWFLSLYSRGYDLRRLTPTRTTDVPRIVATARLVPALSLPAVEREIATNPVSEPRSFGLTPRFFRWIPQPSLDADGASGALALVSRDVIGRTEVLLAGAYGDAASWRGGTLSGMWSGAGWVPTLRGTAFSATQSLSESRVSFFPRVGLDATLVGGQLGMEGASEFDTWTARARIGGSVSHARNSFLVLDTLLRTGTRAFAFSDARITATKRWNAASLSGSLADAVASGKTFGDDFSRVLITTGLSANGFGILPIAASAQWGSVNSGAPVFEQFSIGGGPSTILDRAQLTQRITMPVLPSGISTGTSVVAFRGVLGTAPMSLFYWAGSTSTHNDTYDSWHRVIGLDWSMSVGAIAPAGTPAARAQFGIGESLDEPFRKRVRAYVNLILNP